MIFRDFGFDKPGRWNPIQAYYTVFLQQMHRKQYFNKKNNSINMFQLVSFAVKNGKTIPWYTNKPVDTVVFLEQHKIDKMVLKHFNSLSKLFAGPRLVQSEFFMCLYGAREKRMELARNKVKHFVSHISNPRDDKRMIAQGSYFGKMAAQAVSVAIDEMDDDKCTDKASDMSAEIVTETMKKLFEKLKNYVKEFVSNLKNNLSDLLSNLKTWLQTMFTQIRDYVSDGFKAFTDSEVYDVLTRLFTGLFVVLSLWYLRSKLKGMFCLFYCAIADVLAKLNPENKDAMTNAVNAALVDDVMEAQGFGSFKDFTPWIVLITLVGFGGKAMNPSLFSNLLIRGPSLLEAFANSFKNIANTVYKWWYGKNFFPSKDVEDEFQDLIQQIHAFVCIDNIEKRLMTDDELAAKCIFIFERAMKMKILMLQGEFDSNLRNQFFALCTKLEKLRITTLESSNLFHDRVEPVMIWLSSEPGSGKTTATDIILQGVYTLLKKKYPELFPELWSARQKYARTAGSEYYEGYASQFALVIDDVMAKKDTADRALAAEDIMRAVGTNTFPLNMAFGGKGVTFFSSWLIIATSNFTDYANCGMTDPGAMIRRMHVPMYVKRTGVFNPKDPNSMNGAWAFRPLVFPDQYMESNNLGCITPVQDCRELAKILGAKTHKSHNYPRQCEYNVSDIIYMVYEEFVKRIEKPKMSAVFEGFDWEKGYEEYCGKLAAEKEIAESDILSESTSSSEEGKTKKKVWKKKFSESDSEKENQDFGINNCLTDSDSGSEEEDQGAGVGKDRVIDESQSMVPQGYGDPGFKSRFWTNQKSTLYDHIPLVIGSNKGMMHERVDYIIRVVESLDALEAWKFVKYCFDFDNGFDDDEKMRKKLEEFKRIFYEFNECDIKDLRTVRTVFETVAYEEDNPKWCVSDMFAIVYKFRNLGRGSHSAADVDFHVMQADWLISLKAKFKYTWAWSEIKTDYREAMKRSICDEDEHLREQYGASFDSFLSWRSEMFVLLNKLMKLTNGNPLVATIILHLGVFLLSYVTTLMVGWLMIKTASTICKVYRHLTNEEEEHYNVGGGVPCEHWVSEMEAQSNTRENLPRLNHRNRAPMRGHSYTDRVSTNVGLVTKLSQNLLLARFKCRKGYRLAQMSFITGNTAVMASHEFRAYGEPIEITIFGDKFDFDNPDSGCCHLSERDFSIRYDNKRDLCFVTVSQKQWHAMPSLLSKLPSRNDKVSEGEVVRVTKYGQEIDHGFTTLLTVRNCESVKNFGTGLDADVIGPNGESVYRYSVPNYATAVGGGGLSGYCAGLYLDLTQTTCIRYMHIGRVADDSIMVPLYKEDFVGQLAEAQGYSIALPSVVDECLCKYENEGIRIDQGCYVGTLNKRFNIPTETTLEESVFLLAKEEILGYKSCPVAPAMMEKFVNENDEVISPLAKAVAKISESKPLRMTSWMEECLFEQSSRYTGNFSSGVPKIQCVPLTTAQAIFGDPSMNVDSVPGDTSIGIEFKLKGFKDKKELIDLDKRWYHPDIDLQLLEIYQNSAAKKLTAHVTIFCLKDELRDLERVSLGKTRGFMVGSFVNMLFVKRELGHFVCHLKKHRVIDPGCIGTNPHGFDWTMIWKSLQTFGDCFYMAADFKGYDMTIKYTFLWPFFKEALSYYKYVPYSRKWYDLLFACHSFTSFYIVIFGKMYRVHGKNASGNWLTGIINTFCNELVHRVCFEWVMTRKCLAFKYDDVCKDKLYGDDNISVIKKFIGEHWNMQVFAACLEDLFGMFLTTADKSSDIPKYYENPDDLEFLCRKFVPDGNFVRAPLNKDSIVGMLYWVRKSKTLTNRQQLAINVETAIREAIHFERPQFESFKRNMQELAFKHNLLIRDYSYEGLREDWLESQMC